MKKHKTLIAFIILALLLAIFLGVTLYTNILSYMEVSSQADLKVSGMVDTLNRVQDQINALEMEFRDKTENTMELMCKTLRPFVQKNTYNGPEIFKDESLNGNYDGIVVRIENGEVFYPEGFSGKFELQGAETDFTQLPFMTAATLINEQDNTLAVLLSARQIEDNFYYFDWWEVDDYQASINYEKTIGEAIAALEKLYEAKLLLIWKPEEETPVDEIEVLYASEALGTPETFTDLGITKENLTAETANLTIGKKIYAATYEELLIFDRPAKAIVLLNPISNNTYILNCILIAAGFMLICIASLILWLHWIEDYARDHELTEYQKTAWMPSQLRKRSRAVGMNGALLLFLLLLGYQLLGNISRITQSNQESLDIMMARLEDSSKRVSSVKEEEEDCGIYYAGKIADLYSRVPEVHNAEFLKKANDLIGSEYIMIFDGDGKELLSSNGYVGFTLGDGVNTEKDFGYLLKGIAHVIHEPKKDQFTGKTLQTMGVRMDLGNPDSYGAVIIAIDPEITWESAEKKEIANYVRMLTHQENLSLIISKDSGKVIYASDQDLLGKEPVELGLDPETLQPISMETFEVMGLKRYGAYNTDDQYHYFFMTDTDNVWGDTLKFSIFSALYFILACQLVSIYLFGTSREDLAQLTKDTERLKEKLKQKPNFSVDQEALEVFREDERGDRSRKEWWHDLTPEQKIGQLLKLTVTALLIILFVFLLSKDEFKGRSVIDFILNGSWKRGLNELAIAAIIFCLVSLLALILIKDLVARILSSMLNAKGRTVVGLISSLIQYIAIITSVFFCLSYLGFDTSVLITSASILTLAISLGSKDLVADIMSGIFIIFEGDFHIGDIIEVNGFKGKVIDIGVRSTKLKNSSNDIKIIDNQSVKNVLNKSKDKSWIFINLTISVTQPLDEIEKMLDRELPEIGNQIPDIISGPFYFGISEIGYHWIKICVAATCQQNDANRLKSELNHHLYDIFDKNGFKL